MRKQPFNSLLLHPALNGGADATGLNPRALVEQLPACAGIMPLASAFSSPAQAGACPSKAQGFSPGAWPGRVCLAALLLLAAPLLPAARAQDAGQISNQTSYSYSDGHGNAAMGGLTVRSLLVDPRGLVMGCDGTPLPSYRGFRIGLYAPAPADPTGAEVGGAVPLTATALPAAPGVPAGVPPNIQNSNPFPLSDSDKGRFSLLLDPSRGQLDAGRVYILVLSPPPGSAYRQRRIRITIGARDGANVSYTAASLDGMPVNGMGGALSGTHAMLMTSAGAGAGGPALAALNLTLSDCETREIQISKSGDRATAEPGDTVVYRIVVQNPTALPLADMQILDTPPLGFDLRPDSVRAAAGGKAVPVTLSRSGPATVFDLGGFLLPPGQALTLAYAAQLTPDALRGDGRNSAVVTADALTVSHGTTMTTPLSDGPAVFTLQVRQGILTDTGTVLGRVWVDRSRDGEQQAGEPGLPGAVVILDDSTRIVADANGLFSLATVTAGYHTAALDMQSVPGYTLARNHRFKERNSQSRLVHLEPGGMVRLNFGVVPTDAPAQKGAGR